jgi:hypothetical protein
MANHLDHLYASSQLASGCFLISREHPDDADSP